MSKALRTYPEPLRRTVAEARSKSNTKGIGYWAALDYLRATVKRVQPDAK